MASEKEKIISELVGTCGNPCGVKREITKEDRIYYCKNLRFDES